jgi:2-keto-4-pentenoate hydratase/2-oxohepta-3-ene-1,7-dioic acid hydratase in catechol pathway
MRRTFVLNVVLALALSVPLMAQSGPITASAEPFKLGTFEINGDRHVGIVLRDTLVVELNAANRALERTPSYPSLPMPADMLELISRYEYGLKFRLYEIVSDLVTNNRLAAGRRPTYVHEVARVRTMAPILYPGKILNAGGNFYSHLAENNTPELQQRAIEARRANRGIPYLFIKPSQGPVIGGSDQVVLPYGRDRIDWEVELATVIGRAARYVPAPKAQDHVFGYMVMVDISDRGGRPPGGFGGGTDWFVMKGQDTFAPMGPWIVPKEFYGDPMVRLKQTLTVNGKLLQNATAGDMIHSVWEVIEYASSIVTLYPGDVVNAGTSGGTGMGAVPQGTAAYLKAGDEIVASIDGIGTLKIPVVAAPKPPDGTGSFLPPPVNRGAGGQRGAAPAAPANAPAAPAGRGGRGQ